MSFANESAAIRHRPLCLLIFVHYSAQMCGINEPMRTIAPALLALIVGAVSVMAALHPAGVAPGVKEQRKMNFVVKRDQIIPPAPERLSTIPEHYFRLPKPQGWPAESKPAPITSSWIGGWAELVPLLMNPRSNATR